MFTHSLRLFAYQNEEVWLYAWRLGRTVEYEFRLALSNTVTLGSIFYRYPSIIVFLCIIVLVCYNSIFVYYSSVSNYISIVSIVDTKT